MKKRKIMLGSAVLLAVLLVVGGTMAWFTATADPVENTFTAGTVKIELHDGNKEATNVNPGDCFTRKINVKNTGSKKAMVRIHESTLIEGFTPSTNNPNPSIDIVKFEINNKWEYDATTQHYYYKDVLEPGTVTENLLVNDKICFDGAGMGNEYQGSTFKIELEADAIQATNGAPTSQNWKFDPLAAPPAGL